MKRSVLIIGPIGSTDGGVATIVFNLLNDPQLLLNFEICTLNTRKLYRKRIKHTSLYFRNYFGIITQIIKLISILIVKKIDVVQLYTTSFYSFEKNKLFIKICKIFRKKICLDIHGGSFDKYLEGLTFHKKAKAASVLKKIDAIRVVSEYWKCVIEKLLGTDTNIHVVANGIDLTFFTNEIKEKVNNNSIIYVGSLGERKGIKLLLSISSELIKEFPDIKISIVGNYESINDEREITNYYKNSILDKNNVILFGQVGYKELIEAYSKNTIFVLPSYNENFPMSILEAMASGLVIIATSVGAIPEVIENGVNGFVIEPGNPNELLEKIKALFSDYELIARIQNNNYFTVRNKYDIRKLNLKIFEIYNTI